MTHIFNEKIQKIPTKHKTAEAQATLQENLQF